jgi:hypothetical protein
MDRLIDSYAEGLIERREFEPRLAGFRQRIQEWETQASAMRDEAAQRRTSLRANDDETPGPPKFRLEGAGD